MGLELHGNKDQYGIWFGKYGLWMMDYGEMFCGFLLSFFFLLIFSILEALNSFVLTHGNSLGDVYFRVVDIEFEFSDFERFGHWGEVCCGVVWCGEGDSGMCGEGDFEMCVVLKVCRG